MRFRFAWPLLALPLVAFAPSCSSRTSLGPGENPGDPRGFGAADGGDDDAAAERGLISYCPSSKCPAGWTTCPSSRFPCDVHIWTDLNNCGGCGVECPTGSNKESFACVEGACALQCNYPYFDCDGILDNGCELRADDNDHCGSCNTKCRDPKQPCLQQQRDPAQYGCGCLPGRTYCSGSCVAVGNDDDNCGTCGAACDPTGGGAPEYPNTYYGCSAGQCDKLKCKSGYANCDKSLDPNGCETALGTEENCGACGDACPAGQLCRLDKNQVPQCMCPAGLTYCESWQNDGSGECVDLRSDPLHCGACGVQCTSLAGGKGVCSYGTCEMACSLGRADCNNSVSDGCEVNTNNDPRNCGGCGARCDAVAGQACVGGRCVVEPCPEGPGVVTQ